MDIKQHNTVEPISCGSTSPKEKIWGFLFFFASQYINLNWWGLVSQIGEVCDNSTDNVNFSHQNLGTNEFVQGHLAIRHIVKQQTIDVDLSEWSTQQSPKKSHAAQHSSC